MKTLVFLLIIAQIWHCFAPPVTKNEKEGSQEEIDVLRDIHYSEYLKEVVKVLESDTDFKKKLEEASEDDIKSGKIAHELDFVSHQVRTQLDELKRIELERLIDLKHKLMEEGHENNILGEPLHGHLDRSNKHTFEVNDLKKLIAKTTVDLLEVDKRRREEFKQYELQKEYEKQEKLNHTNNSDERQKLEKEYKETEDKHKNHERLHQPGHKAQLEEVWQEQDHMQQKFDPVAFFAMHDINSDGFWDQNELKALFVSELNKMYEAGAPRQDLREREEEMERMRESVFKEIDLDRDGFISRKEFLDQTKRQEFERDQGWKGIDEQEQFSKEEWEAYVAQQQKMHPPPPGYMAPGQYPPPPPPGGYHPNQVPQGYGVPPPGPYQGQQPPYQGQQPPQSQQQPHPGQYPGQQPPQYSPQQPQPGQYQPPPPNYQVPNPQYQQPQVHNPSIQGQVPGQPLPPQGQQYPQPPAQAPLHNQPSPQVNPPVITNQEQNPHAAGQPVHPP